MKKDIAMQTRCISCGKEQYLPAVYSVSNGETPCVWCGITPPVLTEKEYYEKLRKLKKD